MQVKTFLNVSH